MFEENTTFPITITGKMYTFAVFGRKNGMHIDEFPVKSERIVFEDTSKSAEIIFEANHVPETPLHGKLRAYCVSYNYACKFR